MQNGSKQTMNVHLLNELVSMDVNVSISYRDEQGGYYRILTKDDLNIYYYPNDKYYIIGNKRYKYRLNDKTLIDYFK